MKKYDHKRIEKRWQGEWEKAGIYKAKDPKPGSKSKKFYSLVEFPYPSGDGIHNGHVRPFTAMDVISRKRRMEGYNVLYPIGWDAFGLPTENYAIKTGIHPIKVTKKNTDTFRRQLKSLGISFDWSREINTTDPEYYKWTQWIFLQLFKKGLAYKSKSNINWCLSCKIGLANEEVIDGACERCGGPTEKREKEQWMLAITKYADRLLKDLDTVDYLEKIKAQQRNWIGKKEGINITFKVVDSDETITVFTTTPVNFGASFIVVAPEHPFAQKVAQTNPEAKKYIHEAINKSEIERLAEGKEKTGVFTGHYAINHVTGEHLPIWITDFVLATVGTGAVQGCPGHDQRDWDFAKKFGINIRRVVSNPNGDTVDITEAPYVRHTGDDGIMINSDFLNGMNFSEAMQKTMDYFEEKGWGKRVTTFKLRDWVFSRQRYWGEPIPMIHCDSCGWQPVPEKDLPVKLPNVKNYKPTDTGESPLATMTSWVNTKCPKCKGKARRETDVMPNWAGSSWYFLRYTDAKNKKMLADPKKLKYWTPVDWYNGGMEHTTLHLLYSRFWHKFLYDIKAVPTKEPYKKRTSQGMILAAGGVKMSKSKGNVVNPDSVVATYGADTLRVYEMFMGPFDQAIAWDEKSIIGSRRFVEKVWNLAEKVAGPKEKIKASPELDRLIHQTIKKVGEDIEEMRFNTAISQLMICANEMDKAERLSPDIYETFLTIVAPFAPHITDEIWHTLGNKKSVHVESWPKYSAKKLHAATITIGVQVNSRVRGEISIAPNAPEKDAVIAAHKNPTVAKWLEGQEIKKVIYVPGRILNLVV